MAIRDQIVADIKTAMKAGEADKVSALRFLQSAIKNCEIDLRPNPITDEDVIGVIKKSVKQRKESIEQYEKAGREDLASKERRELAIIEHYLPAMLSEEQIKQLVGEVVAETGATNIKDMGRVMKEVLLRSKGLADNKIVSQYVKERLST
jgi:uncharacterized protein YqeY